MSNKNMQYLKKALIAFLLIMPILCMGDYVPGVILARFKRGVVELPQGKTEENIESIKGNQNLKDYLAGVGMTKIEKVFCEFKPEDTLTQLENGEIVKLLDLSLVFKLSFEPNTNIVTIIDSLNHYSDVIYAEPDHIVYNLFEVNDDFFFATMGFGADK